MNYQKKYFLAKFGSNEHLNHLMNDSNPYVRNAVVRNKNVTREHLDHLSKDTDSIIGRDALKKLKEFK